MLNRIQKKLHLEIFKGEERKMGASQHLGYSKALQSQAGLAPKLILVMGTILLLSGCVTAQQQATRDAEAARCDAIPLSPKTAVEKTTCMDNWLLAVVQDKGRQDAYFQETASDNRLVSLAYSKGKIDKDEYLALIKRNRDRAFTKLKMEDAANRAAYSANMMGAGLALMRQSAPPPMPAPSLPKQTTCSRNGSDVVCTTY